MMGIDLARDLLIKDFVFQNSACLNMKYCVVIPSSFYETIKHTFSIDVKNNLSKILNKKYIITYDVKRTSTFLPASFVYIVHKKDKPIYFESFEEFESYQASSYYYPIFWEWKEGFNRYVCHRYKNFSKPLLFDIKHFWWRLNLEKAKLLLNDKI